MTITRFAGFNGQTYTFPTAVGDQDFKTNFKALAQKTDKLPGGDGGVRQYGIERAPSPIGNIQFSIYLDTESRSAMQPLRDALNKMAGWGMGKLVDTLNGSERFAVCSVSLIDPPEERQKDTDLFQQVKLNFEAPEPYWLTAGNQKLWDGTYTFNSAINWDDGSFSSITGSGNMTVTPSGNAPTLGRFVAKVTGAQSFSRLIVERLVNNMIVDQAVLQMGLAQNDVIEIDPRRQWVVVNGVDRLADFDFMHPDWLRLMSGANTVRVRLDEPTAAISAIVYYFDRYY